MITTTPETTRAPSGHVQIIVLLVDKADPAAHLDAIHAAALASVSAYAEGRPAGSTQEDSWTRWLAGPFTKSVRRADAKTFEKLIQEFDPAKAQVGKAWALAFKPMTYSELPKVLARLQVSGTVLPERESDVARTAFHANVGDGNRPVLALNSALQMSTGKASAQGAHALMAYFLTLDAEGAREWYAKGMPSSIVLMDAALFAQVAQVVPEARRIVDNGLTEIPQGTLTAFVMN
jgi:peptidyl-tRNA hydrolase